MEVAAKKKKHVKRVSGKKELVSLGTSHFINDLMTSGLVPALLPLYKMAFDLSYTESGAILLVSNLTSSVMQPVFGQFTDKRPQTWFLPLGIFLTGLGLAATGFMPSYPMLLVMIAISGLGSGIFHPEASRGAHLAAGEAKGTAQAIFQVGGNFGQAAGPLMMPLFLLSTGVKGLGWFLLIGLAGVLIIWRIMPWYKEKLTESKNGKKKTMHGKRHIPGLVGLTSVVVLRSWTQIGMAAFLPFFYLESDIPLKYGDLLTFLFLGAGAIGTFLGGKYSDRIGHKWLLFASMFLTIPFAWMLPNLSGIVMIIVLFLFGFFVLSSFAVTVVYGQMMLPNNIGLASGLMIGLGVGAGGIGSTLMGWISDNFGVDMVFDLFVIIPILASIITLFLPGEKKLLAGSSEAQ